MTQVIIRGLFVDAAKGDARARRHFIGDADHQRGRGAAHGGAAQAAPLRSSSWTPNLASPRKIAGPRTTPRRARDGPALRRRARDCWALAYPHGPSGTGPLALVRGPLHGWSCGGRARRDTRPLVPEQGAEGPMSSDGPRAGPGGASSVTTGVSECVGVLQPLRVARPPRALRPWAPRCLGERAGWPVGAVSPESAPTRKPARATRPRRSRRSSVHGQSRPSAMNRRRACPARVTT